MCKRAGIILFAIFVVHFLFDVSAASANSTSPVRSMSAVNSEIKSRFDLPAESLDKALRDFAVQANCNISYEPSIVAGLQAPAIKGEFTVDRALSLMLSGTRLRAANVNEDTIQILEKSAATSQDVSSISNNRYPYGAGIVRFANAAPDVLASTNPASDPPVTGPAESDARARDKKDLEEIVVTGTHIRGVSSASPIIEIGREEIERSGYTSISDLMLSVPQNFGGGINAGTVVNNSPVNSRYADNPSGASVPNLRGLGPGSTLTLVDGHRMASGLAGGGTDISSIPLDAVERIEVVTDSASAIYGSDAVAGVVNVILKKNYDGARTSLSYGLSPEGGGTEKRASQLLGTSWSSGNVMIAYEHSQQDAIDARNRDFTSTSAQPDSLLPALSSNSLTVATTQRLSPTTSVFVDGLYIARDADRFLADPGVFPAPAEYPSTLRKYAVTAGLDFSLLNDWKSTLFASAAEDLTTDNSIFLTAPSTTPASAERLLGTMRGIEGNASGSVGDLPTGPVRLAIGAGYRREGFSDSLGITGGSLHSVADGNRSIRYAFTELSLPLVRHSDRPGLNYMDFIASGRSERYSDFGAKTVPKFGLVYAPTISVKMRATWGEAFKAPNLNDTNGVQQLVILDLPAPTQPSGSAPVLIRAGGNPSLRPETANAWSFGGDYSDPALTGLQLSATAFEITYKNRISQIGNPYAALTDPLNAFFVTPSSSASFAQSVVNGYPPRNVFNFTGSPFNPATAVAVVDSRLLNVSTQTARGADVSIGYKIDAQAGSTFLFLNGTYLDLTQRYTPQSAEQTLSGLAFYPPKFRMRTGVTWNPGAWAFTGTVNYLARESNTQVTPSENVGSWTTVDASVRYTPVLSGAFAGLHFSVAALNVFDRDPPFLRTPFFAGLNYDSSNTSALGRFINLQVSKEW
jgi:iron complex outermembrane receptor protein